MISGGSTVASSVALSLLLSPHDDAFISRGLCAAVLVAWPAYASWRSLEDGDLGLQRRLLRHWAAAGALLLAQPVADKAIGREVPFYHHAKLAVALYLTVPHFDGAAAVCRDVLTPLLSPHRAALDMLGVRAAAWANALAAAHDAELGAAGRVVRGTAQALATALARALAALGVQAPPPPALPPPRDDHRGRSWGFGGWHS